MLAGVTSSLLAATFASRPLAIILALGFLTLFVLVAVLVWTRFGQARPIAKCVVLSLLAHLLLLIYAYSTHILYGPPGRWTGQTVTVRLRDAADDVEAAPVASPSPKPWQQPGESTAPLLLATPAEPKDKEPEPAKAIDSAPSVATTETAPPQEQPRLTDLLPDSNHGPMAVPSRPAER